MTTKTNGYFKAAKYDEHHVVDQDWFFFDGSDIDSVSAAFKRARDCAFFFGRGIDAISVWNPPKKNDGEWASLPIVGRTTHAESLAFAARSN